MRVRTVKGRSSRDTGVDIGLLVASAAVQGTFSRSLSARSAVDQGIITGLATGLHYLLTVGTHDVLQAAVAELGGGPGGARPGRGAERRLRALTMGADLAAVPLGLALHRALAPRAGEHVVRGALRQAGWRVAVTGGGSAVLLAARSGTRLAAARLGTGRRLASFPIAVPIGLGIAYGMDRRRTSRLDGTTTVSEQDAPSRLRSVGVAGGVVGTLAGLAYGERALGVVAGRRLSDTLPGSPELWLLASHAATVGVLAAGGYTVFGRAMRRIEAGSVADHPVLEADEGTRWTGRTVSGGPQSLVPWQTLGREGRRHALTFVRPTTLVDRPPGVPDLSIGTVMGEPAKATPVQVYVGLDSAATSRERVDLALAEMDRLGAFDRSLIMLVSPTGTGYVNYVAVAAAQYLARGDVATVTLQYSKRPSPLSLGMIKGAREQNRQLWLRILERTRAQTVDRQRVVLFGESLGAHTSQDVFLHWGTVGPEALGIDRALWIGTPYGSKWMQQVTGADRLDVDNDAVMVVNDFDQYAALDADRRARARFVLVSHDNDGVTKFGADLLTRPPGWLGEDRRPVQHVPGASPRGTPDDMRWLPLTSFFQGLVDMKNAQLPGEYRAWAHDYRPDLARFVSAVYELPASDDQMASVEAALKDRESVREALFASKASSGPG